MWKPGMRAKCIREDWTFPENGDPGIGGEYVVLGVDVRGERTFLQFHETRHLDSDDPHGPLYICVHFEPIVKLPECLTVEHILRQRESEPA